MGLAACTICDSEQNVSECTGCHAAAYCSKKCQKEDWPLHKFLCKSFTDFVRTKPVVPREGNEIHKFALGILYPLEESKPRLHWVPVQWTSATKHHNGFESYKRESFFGAGRIRENEVHVNTRTSNLLRSTLEVYFRDDFNNDGSVFNQALATTVRGQQLGQDWRGPLLVTRLAEREGTFGDIDLEDFRHVTDYFVSHRSISDPSNLLKLNSLPPDILKEIHMEQPAEELFRR